MRNCFGVNNTLKILRITCSRKTCSQCPWCKHLSLSRKQAVTLSNFSPWRRQSSEYISQNELTSASNICKMQNFSRLWPDKTQLFEWNMWGLPTWPDTLQWNWNPRPCLGISISHMVPCNYIHRVDCEAAVFLYEWCELPLPITDASWIEESPTDFVGALIYSTYW